MSTTVLAPPDEIPDTIDARSLPAFEAVACLHCGGRRSHVFLHGEDDLTGTPGSFTFVRCADCGLVYQSPRLTLHHIRPFYDNEYIAHQPHTRWGVLAPLFRAAMGSLDGAKLQIVRRFVPLHSASRVLDVGCGSGSFLNAVKASTGASVTGVDLVDLSDRPSFEAIQFRPGLFYDQRFGPERFDLVTMWHFLEHDYDPARSLRHAREALMPGGWLVIEVPSLDSLSFRLFRHRWPGIQAPQHTALYDRGSLTRIVANAGFEVVEHLPYGAFPPYFYLFCGVAFTILRGRGLNLNRAIYAYFAGQVLLLPLLPMLSRMNFAMQTIVCRKAPDRSGRPDRSDPSERPARAASADHSRPVPTSAVVALSAVFVAAASLAILPVAVLTLFRARRLYAAFTSRVARALLWFWGVKVRLHGSLPLPSRQVVYVSNHSSTLDLFVLVALGLPGTRFFLSGFLQKFIPLAILARLMGTFFTVPQDRQEKRRCIFHRATETLRRSGESVYLSPEGGRITTGEIGPFNKGAFHLATSLAAPIVPLYVLIPSHMDPGMGHDVRSGTVDVFVKEGIETRGWRVEDVIQNRDFVRNRFVEWHHDASDLRRAPAAPLARAAEAHA